ncbi:MAG TPA: hypothetical protein EYQ25_01310 [Planctomycetes bacterium]|nr:hypothetical protein [Planctomycetota bacterium]HIL38413.1 hypothetical protein [Planctomycetota bacterium]
MAPSKLSNFIASAEVQADVEQAFTRHEFTLDFNDTKAGYLASIPTTSSVYFVAGERDGQVLSLYVGKATDLRRRIRDYHRAFQVHCPNDRKLAFFQSWLPTIEPGWELTLRSTSVHAPELSACEADWIHRLAPMVNATAPADDAARANVERASGEYFRSWFARRLAAGD